MTSTTSDRDQHPVRRQGRDGGQEVGHARGHRDRHGEDVVDHQRARDEEAEIATEVGRGDLVVAAAAGVGVDVLPVGSDDGEHQNAHHCGDPWREVDERQAAERQHEEDLLGRVSDRRQRVAGEDRQGDLLGQQRLAEAVAPDRPADHAALQQASEHAHDGRMLRGTAWLRDS